MIEACVGLPGTGKSYFAVQKCLEYMASGGAVFTNIRFRGTSEICGPVLSGMDRYCLAPDAPAVDVLLKRFSWIYQPGQYHYIDPDTLETNFLASIPVGSPKKKILIVLDEVNDNFDSLDRGKLSDSKDTSYRKLFDFLRLHRHYYVDVLLLLQVFDTLNSRLRKQCQYLWKMTDMQGLRLPGLPFKFPIKMFVWQQWDSTGKIRLRTITWPKEQFVFDCYESFQQWDKFKLSNVDFNSDFTGKGRLEKKRKTKMNWFERVALIVCAVGVCVVLFRGPSVASAASGVVVAAPVTVTNTVTLVSPPAPSNDDRELASGGRPRLKVVYEVYGCAEISGRSLVFFKGAQILKGDRTEYGLLIDVSENFLRFVGDDGGECIVYRCDGGLTAENGSSQNQNKNDSKRYAKKAE